MIKFELKQSSSNLIAGIDDCCHGNRIDIAIKIMLASFE